MKNIVAKNVRTNAIAMVLDVFIDDELKREAIDKTTINVVDFVSLQTKNETTGKWLDYVTGLFKEGSTNIIDSKLSEFLSKKSGNDYKSLLDGLWQLFGKKEEFFRLFPNFKISPTLDRENKITGFDCTLGEDVKELRKLANTMSDFSQLKQDASARSKCTTLMQQFQQGRISIEVFEKSVSDIASGTDIMLNTRIDEVASKIWEKFDESNVFLKNGKYN